MFLKASQSLDNFRGDASLATRLYRIATNLSHDYSRWPHAQQQRREQQLAEDESYDEFSS